MSKMINRDNYESYALDYLEGNLPASDRAAFERFLEQHSDIAAAMESLTQEMPVVEADTSIRFDCKEALKRRPIMMRRVIYWTGAVAACLLVAMLAVDLYDAKVAESPEDVVRLLSQQSASAETPNPETVQAETATSGMDKITPVSPEQSITAHSVVSPKSIERTGDNEKADGAETSRAIAFRSPKMAMRTPVHAAESENNVVVRITESISYKTLEAEAKALDEEVRIERLNNELSLLNWEHEAFNSDAILAELAARPSRGRVVSSSEEYVIETASVDPAGEEEEDQGGLRNLFRKKGLKRVAAGIITPLSTISPISVYNDNNERVVEFASIPISRKSNKTY